MRPAAHANRHHQPGLGLQFVPGVAAVIDKGAGVLEHAVGEPVVPAVLATIAGERGVDPGDIEVWFGDEARIGQKNKVTRRWALRGTRPSAPHDQRTASTYIFGAICPKEGKAVGLILPWCNTATMSLQLAPFRLMSPPDATRCCCSIRPAGTY